MCRNGQRNVQAYKQGWKSSSGTVKWTLGNAMRKNSSYAATSRSLLIVWNFFRCAASCSPLSRGLQWLSCTGHYAVTKTGGSVDQSARRLVMCILQSLQLTQKELEECCKTKDAELAACKSQAEVGTMQGFESAVRHAWSFDALCWSRRLASQRESAERAEAEAAWARTMEEQVQQRVSVLEKDFALRIAK